MILDQYARPMRFSGAQYERMNSVQQRFRKEYMAIKASYDAMRDGASFERHWSNADNLSPDSANNHSVRKKLRSRSRFECVENNPYLKGMILTIANDFTGSGPKLQCTDKRVTRDNCRWLEMEFYDWMGEAKYRQKIWASRIARATDGEIFKHAYIDENMQTPVQLNFKVLEADYCTSEGVPSANETKLREVDGIRFDEYDNPVSYFILDEHPGSNLLPGGLQGRWVPAVGINHWFRRERSWHRGIPETTPSLALCALLRRYTLAVVKAAEIAASYTAVLESDFPPGQGQFGPTPGENPAEDEDAFETVPLEHGAFTVLPWGTKLSQLDAKQPIASYDTFVNALLREIARPLLVPFNFASGSSKESNMASAVVDSHIYKEGLRSDRMDYNENDLDRTFRLWLRLAFDVPDYLPSDVREVGLTIRHVWRWDRVGLDHTDPAKVANAMAISHDKGFLTDRDIQESYYNRNLEDWQEDLRAQVDFREEVDLPTNSRDKAAQAAAAADDMPEDESTPPAPKPNGSAQPAAKPSTNGRNRYAENGRN